jgi:hypothetical protein
MSINWWQCLGDQLLFYGKIYFVLVFLNLKNSLFSSCEFISFINCGKMESCDAQHDFSCAGYLGESTRKSYRMIRCESLESFLTGP